MCDTEPRTFAVAEDEGVQLVCKVAARPATNLKYIWLFNNTLDTVEVQSQRVVVNGAVSYIDYVPVTQRDFGTLSCWATNEVGKYCFQNNNGTFSLILPFIFRHANRAMHLYGQRTR